jgi:hypothetical protein
MSGWGLIATLTLLGLALAGLTLLIWSSRRSRALVEQVSRELDAMREALRVYQDAVDDLAAQARNTLRFLTEWQERVEQEREAKQKAEAELFVGAFLPDDAHAARLEEQIKASEDRALAAQGPIRYSSRPSPTSGNPSRREASTQRPRPSGRP